MSKIIEMAKIRSRHSTRRYAVSALRERNAERAARRKDRKIERRELAKLNRKAA